MIPLILPFLVSAAATSEHSRMADAEAMDRLLKPLPDPSYRRDGGGGMIWSPLPAKRCAACNGPVDTWWDWCAACQAKGPIDWSCTQCNVHAGEPCRGGRGRKQRKKFHAARVMAVKMARSGR